MKHKQMFLRFPQPYACNACLLDTYTVWADPFSLAATKGISFDLFYSSYLDVSVR